MEPHRYGVPYVRVNRLPACQYIGGEGAGYRGLRRHLYPGGVLGTVSQLLFKLAVKLMDRYSEFGISPFGFIFYVSAIACVFDEPV